MIKKIVLVAALALATPAWAQQGTIFGGGGAPSGAAGGALKGTYPNPGLADVSTIATSLAIGGCTISTDAFCVTGTETISGRSTIGGITNTGNGSASVAQSLWSGTVLTGGTATTNFPAMFVQPAGTSGVTSWSTSGTGFGMNLASGFAGNFLDFHVAGASSVFSVSSGGAVTTSGNITSNSSVNVTNDGGVLRLGGSSDVILSRKAAASWQFGAADAAVAVAQTTRVQSVVAGTTAANGANWTLIGSLPTGTGTSGDIIWQTGIKTGSGTTQGTATTALTIKGETQAVVAAAWIQTRVYTVSTLPTPPAAGAKAAVSDAVACTFLASLTGGGSAYCPVEYTGSAWVGG